MKETKNLTLIEYAQQVVYFRMRVIKICKEKGVNLPTDKQISDYIEENGLDLDGFLKTMVKSPFEAFKEEINKISWRNKPTDEEILAFFNKYGNNIGLFYRQSTIKNMNPLERKAYLKTIEVLPVEGLVALWNLFVEESAIYYQDSKFFNLNDKNDCDFLNRLSEKNKELTNEILYLSTKENATYIEFQYLSDEKPKKIDNDGIIGTITAYWSEIFERIMIFPSRYRRFGSEGHEVDYFEDVLWPFVLKELGIKVYTSEFGLRERIKFRE